MTRTSFSLPRAFSEKRLWLRLPIMTSAKTRFVSALPRESIYSPSARAGFMESHLLNALNILQPVLDRPQEGGSSCRSLSFVLDRRQSLCDKQHGPQ